MLRRTFLRRTANTAVLARGALFGKVGAVELGVCGPADDFAKAEKIPPDAFEFQMLYGIRRDLQQQLAKQGWRMRVYIPFGHEWYPYFMRRLAERPANALFVLRNLFR